jgi:hypothetical protein
MTPITHLVVNGCSWTYCQGLENPTQDGWPALLAKKLGVKVVNLAVRGCGNDSIHRRTHEYVYENLPTGSKPFFVIAWSQYWRRESWYNTFDKDPNYNDYSIVSLPDTNPETNIERALLDTWNEVDFYRRTYLYKLSLMNLFTVHNIPYVMSDYASPISDHDNIINKIRDRFPGVVDTCIKNSKQIADFCEIARPFAKTPCFHDGPEAQIAVADYAYSEIVKQYQKLKVIPGDYLTLNNFKLTEKSETRDNQTVWRNNQTV